MNLDCTKNKNGVDGRERETSEESRLQSTNGQKVCDHPNVLCPPSVLYSSSSFLSYSSCIHFLYSRLLLCSSEGRPLLFDGSHNTQVCPIIRNRSFIYLSGRFASTSKGNYLKIGNVSKAIIDARRPELVPTGYGMYNFDSLWDDSILILRSS